jgi:excinuclease ABC subunit A
MQKKKKLENIEKSRTVLQILGSYSQIKYIEYVDQNPIGRSPARTPWTYI